MIIKWEIRDFHSGLRFVGLCWHLVVLRGIAAVSTGRWVKSICSVHLFSCRIVFTISIYKRLVHLLSCLWMHKDSACQSVFDLIRWKMNLFMTLRIAHDLNWSANITWSDRKRAKTNGSMFCCFHLQSHDTSVTLLVNLVISVTDDVHYQIVRTKAMLLDVWSLSNFTLTISR